MFRCTVCHFDVELDDVEIRGGYRACICVRCYSRLVDNEKRMSKELRRELVAFMAEVA
ncbi:MAG TPA: hypothetical protein VKV26_06165 [Dehalococcoidia bacterium]|nr:hypothetical protein [Dehalococcoidia bacterium]